MTAVKSKDRSTGRFLQDEEKLVEFLSTGNVATPYIYLLGVNGNALMFNVFDKSVLSEKTAENYTLDDEVVIPVLDFSDNWHYRVTFVAETRSQHTVFIKNGRIVVASSTDNQAFRDSIISQYYSELLTTDKYPVARFYIFPPDNLESYIFFFMNPLVASIVQEYMKRHEAEVSDDFRSSLELFTKVERMIGQINGTPDEIPDIDRVVGDVLSKISPLNIKIKYSNRAERISDFILIYESHYGTMELDSIYLTYRNYDRKFRDVWYLIVNAEAYGIKDDLENTFSFILETTRAVTRGTIYFTIMKKLEEFGAV